ncbi:hypothetical protein [Aquabacter spiritensis]|uniref:Uncharacterized protein n=1 Tax=Aquabacter spiritensis TaxID=933073 RepID=A0A4R3LX86_9HYPH|nr:hypothetical protein [Aquabacter spiritensis]TCT03315.1 hypothetical protein EDC64_110180 [Aquabacter spiritensis]
MTGRVGAARTGLRPGLAPILGCTAALALGLFGPPAAAQQGMPNSRTMSCKQVQDLMTRAGAVLLATGPTTFDRYVRDSGFCSVEEVVKPQWVPTRDGLCYVGGICWDSTKDNGRH